jgi:Ca2+/H+ antiporter
MIIGGFKHREQRFNSRSAGVSSALLFISVGGKSMNTHAHM